MTLVRALPLRSEMDEMIRKSIGASWNDSLYCEENFSHDIPAMG
jgi:hypothetical protein